MKVFYALAQHLDSRSQRQAAFVVANDPAEAALLMKKSLHFSDFAMPPLELSECGGGETAIRETVGEERVFEKGVFPIVKRPAPG